ncbi:hypothetical protein KEH51_07060 [[Brevibacterium] frigoritolerans]|uniref:Uncharacterized protein n=1 Tax=Peribacillus frigoritolerans TaxID=450367 RepID=A0A941J790_9BACI|nr:hypothetical protein [Peribacillus frigoritolerans]
MTPQYESFTESSTEELLKEDEISIETPLPKQKSDQFLIAKSKTFEKKDIQYLKIKKQKSSMIRSLWVHLRYRLA